MSSWAQPTSRDQLRLAGAGLFTWAACGVPLVLRRGPLGPTVIAAYLIFALAFIVLLGASRAWSAVRTIGLLVQSLAAVAVMTLGHDGGAPGALLVMVASEVPLVLRPRLAAPWILLQTAALFLAARLTGDAAPLSLASLLDTGPFLGFQAFAAAAATLAVRERDARKELARTNAELVATRGLFAETHRSDERLRIARDLHDAVGHHLTALILNLELARNLGSDEERAPIFQRALGIARGLLGEVREVVGMMRQAQPLDLGSALATLASAWPELAVHVEVAPEGVEDLAAAHALLRCAQEALTNSARHARARNLWIEVQRDAKATKLIARDDGRGDARLRPGHGLAGMRERVEALGGTLLVESSPDRGTALHVELPAEAARA